MIKTIAELLEQIKNTEKKVLESYGYIKHPTMIGDMYEGLTKDILENAIFEKLDLHVVSGKIKNDEGKMSRQIDCMIVEGPGENIPHTDNYIYELEKVIAVIEVKRNLYSNDLIDSYHNLYSINEIGEPKPFNNDILRHAYRNIVSMNLPNTAAVKKLPYEIEMIYHSLIVESILPLRIVFGYDGFASEYSLREAFINFLDSNKSLDPKNPKKGYGPTSLPSLIICNEYSIIKLNGMPYSSNFMDKMYWPIYGTCPDKPIYKLLELIWTRLSYKYGISATIFGEDMQIDAFHPFLSCKAFSKDNSKGWEFVYSPTPENDLKKPLVGKEWSPVFLDKMQSIIIEKLRIGDNVNIDDKEFIEFLQKNNISVEKALNKVTDTRLVYLDSDRNLKLLTDNCQIVYLPEGKVVAGENNSGRLTRWVSNYIDKQKK